MASITVQIEGINKLKNKWAKLDDVVAVEVAKQVNAGALSVQAHFVKNVRQLTGSRTVTRYEPTREVRVSNRGQYPNSDRGNLVFRTKLEKARRTVGGVIAKVVSGASYSVELEKSGRKSLKDSLKAKEKHIKDRIQKALGRAI